MFEQKYVEIKFFNPTLEDFEIMECNKVYVFEKNSYTEVPANRAKSVYDQWRHRGIFPVMKGKNFNADKRAALIEYMDTTLADRISNYRARMDDDRKAGSTVENDPALTRALRWKEEITNMLNKESPVVEELSFEAAASKKKKETKVKETELTAEL